MTDLLKTQTQWNEFFKIMGGEIQVLDVLKSYFQRAERLRSSSVIQQDQQTIYTSIDLAGEAVIGTNTDANGFLYGKFIAAGPTTELYKDSARTLLVASATTPASATTTLTEQNSSGFKNVRVIRPAGAPADDSDWKIEISQDLKHIINDIYSNILDVEQDKAETSSKAKLQSNTIAALQSAYRQRRTDFGSDIITSFIADFLKVPPTERIVGPGFKTIYDTTSVSGQRLIKERQGIFAELRQSMLDQSAPAGAQSVTAGTPTAGNLTALTGNVGKLKNEGVAAATAITLVMAQHIQQGTVHVKCTSDTVGSARFSIENVLDAKLAAAPVPQSRLDSILAEGSATAQITKQYQDQHLGVDFTLSMVDPVESGDDGTIFSATSITNPNGTDTDFGKVYAKMKRTKKNPPDATDEFTFTLFSNSSRTTQIGSAVVATIVGSETVSITTSRGMVLTTTINKANANTKLPALNDEDVDLQWDLQPPRLGDEWTVAITHTFGSRFNKFLAENYLGSIPTSGAPTIADGFAKFFPTLEG